LDLTEAEAVVIGFQMKHCIRDSLSADNAVLLWEGRNPCMGQFFAESPAVKTLIVATAQHQLDKDKFGLFFRVVRMAGTTMLDLVSDVFMITVYFDTPGQERYGRGLLGMVVTCLVLQMALAWIQNKSKPKKLLKELFFAVLGVKPAVDSYRVCVGAPMDIYNLISRKEEYAFTKGIELACESSE
jgi:hypothetical protein